jgi:hypothetical protein
MFMEPRLTRNMATATHARRSGEHLPYLLRKLSRRMTRGNSFNQNHVVNQVSSPQVQNLLVCRRLVPPTRFVHIRERKHDR